jgi:hypothetical protein
VSPAGARRTDALAVALAVTVAVAATVLGGTHAATGDVSRPTAASVPVSRADLSCPAVARGTGSVVAVAADATPGGGVSVVRNRSAEPVPSRLAGPGRVISFTGKDRTSVEATANGEDAPGAAAVRIARSGKSRGTGAGVCAPPGTQAWFTPVNTALDSVTRLVLTNPASTTAVVDLRLLGPRGAINAVGQRGIAVAAGGTRRLDLAPFAPGVSAMTVGVVATQGLVVAAVQTTVLDAAGVSGTEWISPAPRPRTAVLVGPSPRGAGQRRLVVANVSGSDALVRVQAIGPGGAFRPTSLPTIRVGPRTTVVENVTKIVGRDPVAWSLTSAVPIVVGATAAAGSDFVAESGSPAITAPAVVPVPRGASVVVSFAARLRAGGVVAVTAFDARGASLSVDRLSVAGDVRRWRSRPAGGRRVAGRLRYVVVRLVSGSGVVGDVTFSTRGGTATVPLTSARWTVTRPRALYRPGS